MGQVLRAVVHVGPNQVIIIPRRFGEKMRKLSLFRIPQSGQRYLGRLIYIPLYVGGEKSNKIRTKERVFPSSGSLSTVFRELSTVLIGTASVAGFY
jgi:hypothetical protein